MKDRLADSGLQPPSPCSCPLLSALPYLQDPTKSLNIRQGNKPALASGRTWRWLSLKEDANQIPNYLATNREPHPITSSCP